MHDSGVADGAAAEDSLVALAATVLVALVATARASMAGTGVAAAWMVLLVPLAGLSSQ